MTWFIALLSFIAGIALGYRLPAARAWWHRYQTRRSFNPVVLRPYRPAQAVKTSPADNGQVAP